MRLTLVGSPFVAIQEGQNGKGWRIVNQNTGEMVGWVQGNRQDARDKLKRTEQERSRANAIAS